MLRGLNPVFLLTIGERDLTNPAGWVAFFDNPPLRPHRTFLATLGKRTVAVTGGEARMTLSLAEITAGSFHGDVRFTFYRNSPLVRVEAVVTTEEQGRAIFTSTGEVLVPKFRVGGKESGETLEVPQTGESVVEADVEWTFPLNDAEVISGDGKQVFRQRIDPSDTEGFGSRHLRVPVPLQGRTWVRFEVWDVAAEGAYTQPVWLAGEKKGGGKQGRPSLHPKFFPTSIYSLPVSPARSRTKFRRGGTRRGHRGKSVPGG